MKVVFIKLLLTFLLFNLNIKDSLAQRVAGSIGYFLSAITNDYKDPNFEYNNKLSYSISFYFTNLYKSKHSIGLRFYYFQRDSKPIDPTKENEYFKHGAKNVLSGLLLNSRMKIFSITPRTFYVMNNSFGFAVRDIQQKNDIPQGGDPIPSNPIRMTYVPGIELLHKLNDRIAIHASVQYYYIFGSMKKMFPFSSILSFEIGLSFSEEFKQKDR